MKIDYTHHQKIAKVYPAIKTILGENTKDIKDICHYTSTEVLDILLENATFRASNIFYLNDSSEYVGGVKILKNIFKGCARPMELLEEISENKVKSAMGLFSVSFSENYDLLQQWVTYAKESGVCIVLDGELLHKISIKTLRKVNVSKDIVLDKNIGTFIAENNNCSLRHLASNLMYRIIYDASSLNKENIYKAFVTIFREEEYKEVSDLEPITMEETEKFWEKPENKELAKLYLQLIASFLKNNNFDGEKEIRAIFFAEKNNEDEDNKMYFSKTEIKYHRMKNGILRPYCDVTFVDDSIPEEPMLPLKVIVIGPSGNQQTLFDSIVHRIKYGKKNVFKYTDEGLKKRFIEYVCGAIEGYLYFNENKMNKNDGWNICIKLKEIWEKENDLSINEIKEEEFLVKEEYISLEQNQNKCFEIDDVVNEIMENNYFSKEGIWIKKSKIPYIF